MEFSPRREYAQLITSGGQLVLVVIGFQIGTREGWMFCLPAIALFSLFAWRSSLKRLRAIRDTPTSRIASAAQGYVEVIGRGQDLTNPPMISHLRMLPCLWYRYRVEERYRTKNGDGWRTVDSGESHDSFIVNDDTGTCVVDPQQAEISTIYRDQWQNLDKRYTEWKLLKNDLIYVLGEFHTQSGSADIDARAELNGLLAEWKRDMPALHKRFDLNNDGVLDMAEWMLARKAAKREVDKKIRELQAQPAINIISQPRDGKLFLISNLTPEDLSRRYLYWSWGNLFIFFATLAGTGWLLQTNSLIQ